MILVVFRMLGAVHYVGTLEDGTKFDSSRDRDQEFNFKLGIGNVIKGWDSGVATMKKGEKCILKCRSDYAYGEQGSPPAIPGGATLNFEVELIHWKSIKDILGDGGIIKKVIQNTFCRLRLLFVLAVMITMMAKDALQQIIQEGEKFESPRDMDEVTVKYTIKDLAGNIIIQTDEDGESFSLDGIHQLNGMPNLVKTMKKGEVCSAQVKSPCKLSVMVVFR